MNVRIERLRELPAEQMSALVAESERAGLGFVRRLAEDWARGLNRFDRAGETLFGAWLASRLVGVCGLNIDPYTQQPGVGRVRHLYVLEAHRGQGIGGQLVRAVVEAARGPFDALRLRTDNAAAARLYESLGFRRQAGDGHCSHRMELSRPR
jgi:ribosomal protein S18 acetylase RimI-like enzyme